MIIDAKDIIKVLDEYELDILEDHIKEILMEESRNITAITAAKIKAVREIRDRLKLPEIKA